MPSADVLTRPSRGPDQVFTYGSQTDQLADLRFARGSSSPAIPPAVIGRSGAAAGLAGLEPRAEVISLAGVCDLTACYRQGLDGDAAGALIGGGPEKFPDRYAAADPMSRVPIGVRVTLVHGTSDQRVPWDYSRDFAAKDQAAGDQADLELLSGCGHFELIDPLSAAWPVVLAAFQSAADRLSETS
jgi:hypothetical protein